MVGCAASSISSLKTQVAPKILVFSKTAGYRHASIPYGIAAIRQMGAANQFTVDATEDSSQFNDGTLSAYRGVVFLCTTGQVLNQDQMAAFQRYIEAGGGFVGIHSASDTEHAWPWYGRLVGAYFFSHPAIQSADIRVLSAILPPPSCRRFGNAPMSGTTSPATPVALFMFWLTLTKQLISVEAWDQIIQSHGVTSTTVEGRGTPLAGTRSRVIPSPCSRSISLVESNTLRESKTQIISEVFSKLEKFRELSSVSAMTRCANVNVIYRLLEFCQ
jgi:hypothetical protein